MQNIDIAIVLDNHPFTPGVATTTGPLDGHRFGNIRMIIQPPPLEKEELTQLVGEFGLGKPAAGSGVLPGWGNRRYNIETGKDRYELRLSLIHI